MRPTRFLFVLLTLPIVASAQEPDWGRFFPLEAGNRWMYKWDFDTSDLYYEYHRFVVTGDTTIGGAAYALVQATLLNRHYRPIDSARCALRVRPVGTGAEIDEVRIVGAASCSPALARYSGIDLRGTPQPGTVQINGEEYLVEELLYVDHGGGTCIIREYARFAGGIGPVEASLDIGGICGFYRSALNALVFASVDGATYGVEPELFEVPDWRRFYPLSIGDQWVYALADYPGGSPYEWVLRTIVGDTVLAGTEYRLVREQTYAPPGSPRSESLCAVRLDEEVGWFEWLSVDGPCNPYEESYPSRGWPPLTDSMYVAPGDSFSVGGIYYPNEATFLIGARNPGWPGDYNYANFVTDVGLLYWEWFYPGEEAMYLVYGRVGGVEYGTGIPVTLDPTAEPPTAFAIGAAYPNPFRDALTLEVGLPAPSVLRVEVFDVLGRRVHTAAVGARPAGRSEVRLDGSAWAPGVYVVRVTTADGWAATRRVVRAR
ncbi:MAG TPA: T9SS type A sorting domain-containing protein [Rubricoccaceae bacterium]|nr:T9SS type A sorting domain-containing protein [Rubricoccaceae bacterium]